MDNAYLLLLILKKRINVAAFIDAYFHESMIIYDKYLEVQDKIYLNESTLSEFEFKYFVSYLSIMGLLHV